MTGSKVDVEPGNESMNEIRFAAEKRERSLEGKILFGDCVQVNLIHLARVGHASLEFDGVDEGFRQSGVF